MREWQGMGMVETIYEDDQEEEEEEGVEKEEEGNSESMSFSPSAGNAAAAAAAATQAPPLSPFLPLAAPPPLASLESKIIAWSQATGCKPDIVIWVHDKFFHLHKESLVSRSRYLKRRLKESSDFSVSPPSNITAETFAQVAAFCYGSDVVLTPSNFAALRVAAEWLEMPDEDDGRGGLLRRTESYFFQEVATDAEAAAAVLRSSVALLAGTVDAVEAAAAAALAVKCVEVLAGSDGGWLDDVAALPAEEFRLLAEAMRTGFAHDHDLLYRVVDFYLQNHEGKLTEEEKSRICYTINCTKLSHNILLHLVQNSHLPLRFLVQAMLVEQLHTHRSFFHYAPAAAAAAAPPSFKPLASSGPRPPPRRGVGGNENMTLGAILQRDAALRQSANIRTAMEATGLRIESLERDLAGLRQRLRWSEEKQEEMDSVRSASFRIVRTHDTSSADAFAAAEREKEPPGSTVAEGMGRSCNGKSKTRDGRGGLRWKLVHGFKSMFRRSGAVMEGKNVSTGGGGGGDLTKLN